MDSARAEAVYAGAARQALDAFGIRPAALQFEHLSENVTFRVTDASDGARLVLRLHRPGYHDLAALRSERMWTRALRDAGIAAPQGVRSPAGEDYVCVPVPGAGEDRWAGLARWIEGEILADIVQAEADIAANARHFHQLGALIAALHRQASGWTPPAGFRRHALDADGLMGPAPFWGAFWRHPVLSPAEQDLLLAARDRLHAALSRYGKDPRTWSLIHADLHPRNVLVGPGGAAVIDFDDAAFGWRLYDLAVALHGYQDHPGFAAFRAACLAGYASVFSLPADAEALLPMFLLIRGLALMGWLHQRPEVTSNARAREFADAACRGAAAFVPSL